MEPDHQSKLNAGSGVSAAPAATSVCPQCGEPFRCGMEGGDAACWCAGLPPVLPVPARPESGMPAAGCLCPVCLQAALSQADGGQG